MAMRAKISTATGLLNGSGIADLFPSSTSILEVYSGTIPTDADTAVGAQTLLASMTLPASAWGTPAARAIAKSGTWQDASANAGSATAPTWARLKNAADTERLDFTCGVGSGDISWDGTITTGQAVTLSTLSITI